MIFANNQRARCVSIVLGIGRLTAHDLLQVVNQNGYLFGDGSGSLTVGHGSAISECKHVGVLGTLQRDPCSHRLQQNQRQRQARRTSRQQEGPLEELREEYRTSCWSVPQRPYS